MANKKIAVLALVACMGAVAANAALVAHYDFGDGDLTNNSSGNGYVLAGPLGTAANITANPDAFSAHFDGSAGSSYFEADLKPNGARFSAFTVSFWWKTDTLGQDTHASLMSSKDNQSLNDWQIEDAGAAIRLNGDNDASLEVAYSSLAPDTWYHTVLASDGSNVSFYLTEQNAEHVALVGTVSNAAFNLQDLRIGGNRVGNLTYDSDIAMIRVYDNVLDVGALDGLLGGEEYVPPQSPGLTLTFVEGVPVSLKNASGVELLSSSTSDGFYVLESNNTKRHFSEVTQTGPLEYHFSIPGSPEQLTVQFGGANDYLSARITAMSGFALAGERLYFELDSSVLGVLPLNYMVDDASTAFSARIERRSLWETSAANPLGAFALYEVVDDEQEDEVLLDLWTMEGLPHPAVTGVWDRAAAAAWLDDWVDLAYDTSYLNIVPADLAEHDDFIPYMIPMDARAVYIWNSIWRGEYWLRYRQNDEINPAMYPNGLTDLLAFKNALPANNDGMMLHYLCGTIGEEDPEFSATTVSPDLQSWGAVTLNAAVSSSASTMIVVPDSGVEMPIISTSSRPKEAPPVIPRFFDFKTFRLGSEWISASSVTDQGNGTWLLSGVTRGKWNTSAQSHADGTSLRGYLRPYNQDFVPDPNSPLLETIATRWANLNNTLETTRSEFDGFENHGATGIWGKDKFAALVYEHLDHPTVANTSGGVPPDAWLEYRFNRVKNVLSGEFQTRQHVGLFPGDESRITPGLEDLEYTMFKFLDLNNRGFSLGSYDVKGVALSTLQNYGLTDELLHALQDWKKASFALTPAQRAAMDTFRSVDGARATLNGNHPWARAFWRLDGPVFRKWLALGTDVYTHEWHSGQEHGTITPRFYLKNGETQTLEVPAELSGGADQVQVIGRVLPEFDSTSASNIDLMSYMGSGNSLNINAQNSSSSAVWQDDVQNSYSLSSTLDLTSNRGLGLWVTGDGSGATLVIRLSRFLPKGRDYVVPINFTGRRWIEIPTGEQGWRAESWGYTSETTKYFDYDLVKQVSIWIGHLPANTSCSISVEDLTALAEIQEPLVNPTITLGEQSLNVNTTIAAENHFILDADGTFTVYDEWWNGVYTQQLASALLPGDLTTFSIQSSASSSNIWLEVGVQASNETIQNPAYTTRGTLKSWLEQYGLVTDGDYEAADFLDADLDGLLNWEEYVAGTDPTNSASAFRFSGAGFDGEDLLVSWQAVSGKYYKVWFKTNLLDSTWSLLDDSVPGVEPITTHTSRMDVANQFYRIEVE